MKIATSKLNNEGLVLSKSNLREHFLTELSKYSRLNIFLFDNCILDSPSFVDWVAIKRFLIEEYPDFYEGLKNSLDGSIEFTSKRMFFLLMHREPDDILHAISNLLQAEEHINSCNSIYDSVKFKKSSDTMVYKPSYIVTSRVTNRSKVDSSISSLFNSIAGNNNLVYCSGYEVVCKHLCKKYGVDYKSGCSIFLENEIDATDMLYLDDFITGKLKGNTPLAEMLYKDIEEYYRKCCLEYSTEKSSCMSFEEHIFNLCVDDLILNQKQFREEHPEYKPFLVDNWSVHYYSEANSYNPSLPYNTFGLDCIDYFSGETLNVKNSLIGLCGEFVAESDLARNSLKALGMPLELYINETKKVKYYPLVNVRTENNTFLEPRLNNNVYYIPEEHTLVTENDDIDKIINSFLSWRNNFKELSHSVSTRLSFSDIEVLNTIESRLKELGVF